MTAQDRHSSTMNDCMITALTLYMCTLSTKHVVKNGRQSLSRYINISCGSLVFITKVLSVCLDDVFFASSSLPKVVWFANYRQQSSGARLNADL